MANWPSFKCIGKWKGCIGESKRNKEEIEGQRERIRFLTKNLGFPISQSSLFLRTGLGMSITSCHYKNSTCTMIVTEKSFDKDIKDGEDSGYSLLTKSIDFCILLSTSLWEFIVELCVGEWFPWISISGDNNFSQTVRKNNKDLYSGDR